MFSTTKFTPISGPRYLIISRRKTSLPLPGLEWVTSVTVECGYFGCASAGAAAMTARATAATAARAIVLWLVNMASLLLLSLRIPADSCGPSGVRFVEDFQN